MSHDPSEIILICWFSAQETLLICINVDNSWAIFVETVAFFDEQKVQKNSIIWNRILIIHNYIHN